MKVTLDNGEEIRCTPDHKFMLRDSSYEEAINLCPGTSLMPEYFKLTRNGYLGIKSRDSEGRITNRGVHRLVMEAKLGRFLEDGEVPHHKDENKLNNTPDNLELMSDPEHRAYEIRKTMTTDKWKDANYARLVELNQSDFMRESCRIRQVSRNKSDIQRACTQKLS